jgi:peptide/nickel transport system ATP-binding protein
VQNLSINNTHPISLGIVGESGSGKSTLARLAMALERPDSGSVRFQGADLQALDADDLRRQRRQFQMVFQDPFGSLDPRMTVESIVGEPLEVAEPDLDRAGRREKIIAMLASVGLPSAALERYPHEFSGGQRQRIALARALVTGPALVVADEPVSALDVSVQAQVLNLMMELQETLGLAYLFISHDLAVVRAITDRVAVMYLGRIVEEGETQAVFEGAHHPYARALIAAAPKLGAGRPRLPDAPSAHGAHAAAEGGCPYAPRCPLAQDMCRAARPELRPVAHGGRAACHFA